MATSKRAQEALGKIYKRIRREIKSHALNEDIMDIIEEEYQKEGGDINDLFGIK